jgi:hypothetical protein
VTEETSGRVVASTRTETASFAVVELDGGARVLARGEPDRMPQADEIVDLLPLDSELCAIA